MSETCRWRQGEGYETCSDEKQEKGATLFRRRSAHKCPQCGNFRAFDGTLFPTKKQACDAVICDKSEKAHQSKRFNDAISNLEVIL